MLAKSMRLAAACKELGATGCDTDICIAESTGIRTSAGVLEIVNAVTAPPELIGFRNIVFSDLYDKTILQLIISNNSAPAVAQISLLVTVMLNNVR